MPELLPPLPEDRQRGMCVAAHPDDIAYGAASAVARWTAQGKSITYLLATRGEAGIDAIHPSDAARLREAAEREGARRVGVEGLGGGAFDVADFLQYFAALGGAALGVEHAVLLDLYRLLPEGPPPWAAITAPEDGS